MVEHILGDVVCHMMEFVIGDFVRGPVDDIEATLEATLTTGHDARVVFGVVLGLDDLVRVGVVCGFFLFCFGW